MITEEQWSDIQKILTFSFNPVVNFMYNEHKITVQKHIESATSTILLVYLDGEICGLWMNPKNENFHPLAKLFWCHNNRRIYTKRQLERLEKGVGKRYIKKNHPEIYTCRHDIYQPEFKSLKKLVSQFKKIEGLEVNL